MSEGKKPWDDSTNIGAGSGKWVKGWLHKSKFKACDIKKFNFFSFHDNQDSARITCFVQSALKKS